MVFGGVVNRHSTGGILGHGTRYLSSCDDLVGPPTLERRAARPSGYSHGHVCTGHADSALRPELLLGW